MNLIVAVFLIDDEKDAYVGLFRNTLNSDPEAKRLILGPGALSIEAENYILKAIKKILTEEKVTDYEIDFFQGLKIIRRGNSKFTFLRETATYFTPQYIEKRL